ncbi:MAG: restriction endonuclease subunit S [Gallionella sp.]|nr:restriction endonuclease subunit S [Gallionella sp.]
MKIAEGILPAGWIGLLLEDVAEIHDNLREPVNSSERAKRPGTYPYYGATGQVGWIDDFRQDGEYVLLGEDGAPFFEPTKEKAYLVSGKCWVNNHAHVLKGREGLCLNRYLLYALNQTNYRGYANGTTRLKLTQSAMRQLPINLAPFAEQLHIVAKIEELFSELDKGIENLKTAQAQLKVYRQALLKHAFEGKLTVQWRAENQDKLETADALLKRSQQERAQRYQQQLADWQNKSPSVPLLQRGKTTSAVTLSNPPLKKGGRGDLKPKAPKPLPPLTAEELTELPELPEGWGWVKYGDLCSIVRNGISAKPEGESGTPIFRISAVRPLFFDMTDIRFIDNTTGEFDAYCLERGDLVFTRYNGSRRYVGVCAEYRSDEKRLFPDKLVQTRVFSKNMSTSYLEKALNAGASRKFVESKIRTTAGQSGVSGDDIKNIPVPFCSTDEQIQIVEELESKLSEVDQLDLTLTTSLQQSEALRQSILKRAFSGQLVPQDPHDETAFMLLARIRAERAKSPHPPFSKGGRSRSGGGISAKARKGSNGDKLSPTAIIPLTSMDKES